MGLSGEEKGPNSSLRPWLSHNSQSDEGSISGYAKNESGHDCDHNPWNPPLAQVWINYDPSPPLASVPSDEWKHSHLPFFKMLRFTYGIDTMGRM
jgi:hypothetical protein